MLKGGDSVEIGDVVQGFDVNNYLPVVGKIVKSYDLIYVIEVLKNGYRVVISKELASVYVENKK